MKKYILLTVLFNFSILMNAQSLLDIEKKLDNKDRYKEYEILKIYKLENNLLDFNKLSIGTSVTNTGFSKDNFNISGELKYSILSYKFGYAQNEKKYTHSIGISKTINEYFYNRFKENDIDYQLKLLKTKELYNNELFNKIDIIKKYYLLKKEKEIISKEEEYYKTQLKVVDLKNSKGFISKVDYDFIKNNYTLVLEKLKLYNLEMEAMLNTLKLNNIDLKYVETIEKLDEIILSDKDIEKYVLNNEIKLEKLNIEKMKMDNFKNIVNEIPKINLSFDYNLNNKNYSMGVSVFKDFDLVNHKYLENSLNKNKVIEKETKINILTNQKINDLRLDISRKKYELNELKLNIKNLEQQVLIIDKKFELGMESFVNLLNKKNELLKMKINLLNKEFDFEITKLKIKKGLD